MPAPASAVYLGDFTVERTCLLAAVPLDADEGGLLRGVTFVSERCATTENDFWIFAFGLLELDGFKVSYKQAFKKNLTSNLNEIRFDAPLSVPKGSNLAIRLIPNGAPPPISGLSIAPKWITLRRSSSPVLAKAGSYGFSSQ